MILLLLAAGAAGLWLAAFIEAANELPSGSRRSTSSSSRDDAGKRERQRDAPEGLETARAEAESPRVLPFAALSSLFCSSANSASST